MAAQVPRPFVVNVEPGVRIEQRVAPLARVGCYVPGGRYPLPSTLIMTVVPAVAAGVNDITVVCPDLHDIAVAKCVAGRDKDAVWIRALLRHGMIEAPRFMERLRALDPAAHPIDRIVAWADLRIRESQAGAS